MLRFIVVILCASVGFINGCDFDLLSRVEWDARPPKSTEHMENPVPFVIIHHSAIPAACNTTETCIEAMQWMQNFHQDDRGWVDIGYNFAVGGDGKAYVGRGWSNVGAHAPTYNDKSIGICLIGDWTVTIPPPQQLATAQKLIEFGVLKGHINANYILHGHKQVREGTECPGGRLFKEIATWEHFSNEVESKFVPEDLKNI